MKNDDPLPILLDARQAAKLCGLGRSTWFRLSSAGQTPQPVRLGSRVLWSRDELTEWARAGCPNRQRWQEAKTA